MAKAGYMTPDAAWKLSEIEQCRFWIEAYRERDYETKMVSKSLTSLRAQHLFEEDIQTVARDVRWNADYDMKRKLVNVRDVDGLITADTEPWRSIDEFEQARDLLEDWKRSQRRVLKTRQDFDDMIAWGAMRASRRRAGTKSHNKLPPVAAAVLKVLAWRDDQHQRVVPDRDPRAEGDVDVGNLRGEGHRDGRQERQAARHGTGRAGRLHHASLTTTTGGS